MEDLKSFGSDIFQLQNAVVDLFANMQGVEHYSVEELMEKEMEFQQFIDKIFAIVGDYPQLELALEQLEEKYVDICKEVGMIYLTDKNNFEPAIAFLYFEKALKYRPKCAHVLLDMGIIHSWLGCNEQAIETWIMALDLCDPNDPDDAENISIIKYNLLTLGVEL